MEIIPVGLDIGYGYTKIVTNAGRWIFPTIVGRAEEIVFQSETLGGVSEVQVVEHDGQRYFVGEAAERFSLITLDRRDREWVTSAQYQILARSSWMRAGLLDRPCSVVTGLPVEYYADRGSIIDLFTGRRLDHIEAASVKVIPQPFGTLFDLILKDDGSVEDEALALKTVGVIDVGYQTTDCILVDRLDYIESASGTSLGISAASETVGREIQRRTTRSFLRRTEIEEATSNPIGSLAAPIVETLATHIEHFAKTLWARRGEPDIVVLTGGGVLLVGPHLKEKFAKVRIADEPQLANARGYWKYAHYLLNNDG